MNIFSLRFLARLKQNLLHLLQNSNYLHSKRVVINQGAFRLLKLPMLAIFTTLLIIACSGNAPEQAKINGTANTGLYPDAECQVVKHDLGETKVCGQPQKVVVFGPYMLDLLLSLDVQPAGYATYANAFALQRSDYFERPSQQIPYLGSRVKSQPMNLGVLNNPSLEALSRLQPDLILSEADGVEDKYSLLSQIAPTLVFKRPTAKNSWQQSIQAIAQALRRTEQVPRIMASRNQRLANLQAELAPVVTAHPRLLLLGADQLNQNIRVFDHNEYIGGLLADVGFQIVSLPGQENTERATFISSEALPSLKAADTIIVMGYNLDPSAYKGNNLENQLKNLTQEWNNNVIAQTLPASQKNRVYFVTYYLWNGLNGPIGAELILKEIRQLLL